MLKPGDVVLADLRGAKSSKRRPTVVVSSPLYLAQGLDVAVGELTTQLAKSTTPTDYLLQDWAAAGLHYPTAFRAYFGTVAIATTVLIGHLTDRDWQEVQARLRLALAAT